jgi:hypothetical protein
MAAMRIRSPWAAVGVAGAAALAIPAALAQSIEPRAYSNAPVGMNFVIAGFARSTGGVAFDASLPLTDPKLAVNSALFAYARALDLWGMAGKVDVIVPYAWLSGSAQFSGATVERQIEGLGDPALRLAMNFVGAPALSAAEFRSYRQDLIVGASVQVSMPVGQYDPTRLINIGSHRWSIKPEIGASQAFGAWVLEGKAAVTAYGTNDDFYNGGSRSQDPLYAMQLHAIYNFGPGRWVSVDTTYYSGGRTTVNGTLNNDLQANWRTGATLAWPVDAQNSVKLYLSTGVSARTGNNFDLIGAAWQYRWGGGL